MHDDKLARWFDANKTLLEDAYTAAPLPWQQSGFGLNSTRSAADWATLRRPIADCIDHSGTLLDIGCANGYLLECVMRWTGERGVTIDPYGLDFSPRLVALAQTRLPPFAHQIYLGNAWDWAPPRAFDYVNTTLDYVPSALHKTYLDRLITQFLNPGGMLLVAEYGGSRNRADPALHIDRDVTHLGFTVAATTTGVLQGLEMTRVAVIKKPA